MRALAIAELELAPPSRRPVGAIRIAETARRAHADFMDDPEAELLLEQVETTRNMLVLSWRLAFQVAISAQDMDAWGVEEAAWSALRSAGETRRLAAELGEMRVAAQRRRAREESFSSLAASFDPFLG